MFYTSYDQLSAEHQNLVITALGMMERRSGVRLPDRPGKGDPSVKPLRLTLDPLSVQSRPLIAYLVINLAGVATKKWLVWARGARYETVGGITYAFHTRHFEST